MSNATDWRHVGVDAEPNLNLLTTPRLTRTVVDVTGDVLELDAALMVEQVLSGDLVW